MLKIHIIGGSGSGKSYIAALLSEHLGIPHYDLDDIHWDKNSEEYGVEAPTEQRDRELLEIVSRDEWIIEGVYRSWIEPSVSAADRIIALMIPLHVQEERIWKRYEARISGAVVSPKKETLESTKKLLAWNEQYNLVKLPQFLESCSYQDKLVKVTDYEQVFDLFRK